MMADPLIVSCRSVRKTVSILLTISCIITPSLAQSINLALGKTVTMSSTEFYLYNWTGSLAVDGTVPVGTQSTNDCRCCSSTQQNVNNWLTVDLGEIYTISSINVQGRTDDSNGRLHGTTLYILNTTGGTEQHVFTQQVNSQTFTWTAQTGTLTRLVTLRDPNNELLIVCEIRVFKRDCVAGKYGPVCTQDCSDNCAGDTCDQTSGHCDQCIPGKYGDMCTAKCPLHCAGDVCHRTYRYCTHGCEEGYQGQTCESECNDRRYGPHCVYQCGNCLVVSQCNKQNGTCMTGCLPGYKPGLCKEECDQGTYGHHCTNMCGQCLSMAMCNTQNGVCMTGCQPGFKHPFCKDGCDDGHYGKNCSQECGNCADMTSCNKKNGICMTGCTDGYQPGLCKQQCESGTFGANCQSTCRCSSNSQCSSFDGNCGENACLPKWKGPGCQECDDGMYGQNCSLTCVNCVTDRCSKDAGTCNDGCVEGFTGSFCTQPVLQDSASVPVGPIVGSVVAVLIVAIVIVFVFLFVRRYRQKQDRTERPENSSRSRGNEAFEGNITDESNNSQNKYDFLDLDEHQGQENPYSEINAARQECIYEGTSSDIRDTELHDMYQRLSDIKLETRSAELEMKKRQIEDEIRKAEKKLTAIKREVENGKKKKRKI